MIETLIRSLAPDDIPAVRELTRRTLAAYHLRFGENANQASDITELADLARNGHVFVALAAGNVIGALGYMPPGAIQHPLFSPRWALIRMLVLADPVDRSPVAASLIAASVSQAAHDAAEAVCVYSWPSDIMFDSEFRRFGFEHASTKPEIHGNIHSLLLRSIGSDSR